MEISVLDGSNYFKGLLLLIRKDRRITESEIVLMERIGKSLGFEREFCSKAIQEILVNNYIEDKPPLFSSKDLACMFIKDGFVLANADNEIHSYEKEWLRSVAKKNGLDSHWFRQESEAAKAHRSPPLRLEVDVLRVKF